MNVFIKKIEQKQIKSNIPNFRAGDTVKIRSWVIEGDKKRIQAFEGIVIAINNRGINSSFTVRKVSNGEGIERVFQTHSPNIESIELKRQGMVRKAKLYYLRKLFGKSARIKERIK